MLLDYLCSAEQFLGVEAAVIGVQQKPYTLR
jgi:hypothetical protein